MTKYLIIFLIIALIIMAAILVFVNLNKSKSGSTPAPVVTFSPSPTSAPTPAASASFEDQAKTQTQADINFAKWDSQTKALYPWIDKLPIETSGYHVHFDIDTKQFMAYLYPDSSSNVPEDQQIAALKAEIQSKLQDLILDYIKYNIVWQVKSQ